jgi:inner membrane protein
MIGSMFIIDPLYTVPLLIGFFALLIKPHSRNCICVNRWGLIFSTAYLSLALCLQQYVVFKVKTYVAQNKIEAQQILVTPTPFTIAAWRVVVVNQQSYYEGFYGLLPYTREFMLTPYERRLELTEFIKSTWAFKRLEWFTSGFYKLAREDDKIYISDLRMGMEPGYSFSFYVAKREGRDYVEIPNERHRTSKRRKISDIGNFWCEKLWVPSVSWCQ